MSLTEIAVRLGVAMCFAMAATVATAYIVVGVARLASRIKVGHR